MGEIVRDVFGTTAGRVRQWAELFPDQVAIIDDRGEGPIRSVTYRELNDLINQLTHALLKSDIKQGERVAWMSRNSVEAIAFIAAAGAAKLGALSLNHRLQTADAEHLLNFANASLLLVEADAKSIVTEAIGRTPVRTVVVFDGAADASQLSFEDFIGGQPTTEPPASSFVPLGDGGFTSGTTGKPKRVMRDVAAKGPNERTHISRMWGGDAHVFITSGAISSGSAGGYYTHALARGDMIVLQRKFDAEDWLRLVDKYKVSVAYLAPTIVRQICNLPENVRAKYDISSIRRVVAGASKWSYALKLAYREVFPEHTMWEIYGSTELGSNLLMEADDHWGRPESCGRPIAGVEVILRDENGVTIEKPHDRGVVWVRSDFTDGFLGYEGDEAATATAVDGVWKSVGDVAYFDEEGFFYICDRVKDMIVSGGVNVFPAEVEAVIDSYPGVLECAVFGVPDDVWGERVHGVAVAKPGYTLDANAIISYAREHLASHKVPRAIDFLDELPHTVSGKILKREVRDRYWAKTDRLI